MLAALGRLGLLDAAVDHRRSLSIAASRSAGDDAAHRSALARRIWNTAQRAQGSPVVRYLTGRSISVPPPPTLRWAPSLRRPNGNSAPAMVARIDDAAGELIGVHRTWLDRGPDGQWCRRDRAMLGRAAGGAVHLAPAAEMLMVGEGIETTLAAMTATAMPGWAALSTSGLVALALPPIVHQVVILADNDRSGAGEHAARVAAARWLAEGRRVRIAMPPAPGTDMADVLAGSGRALSAEAGDVIA